MNLIVFRRLGWLWLCWGMASSALALPGTALRFNGAGSSASVLNNPALDTYPMTVTAWFRCETNNGGVQVIVAKYGDSTYNGWAMVVQNGQLHGYFYRDQNTWAIDAYSGTSIVDGLWHHAALSVDFTGGKLFLDGNLVVSTNWHGIAGAMTTSVPLTFGGLSTGAYWLKGDLDEVTLWSRGLTSSEVNYLKHRQLRGGEDGLLGYWKFNDGAGSVTAADSSNHGFIATLLNSPTWVPSGAPLDLSMVATNCVKFAGTTGIVTITNAPDLNPYPFTATAWFRTPTNFAGLQLIAAKYIDSSFNGWALVVQSGQLRGFFYRNGDIGIHNNFAMEGTASPLVADGGWHHAALVVDATGGKIFLDGSLMVSSNWAGPAGPMTSTAPVTLGALPNGYPLIGDVDEVMLWSRALTGAEIAAQKNLPHLGNEANLVGYWKLDEGVGTKTFDSTTNAHTGALSGGVSWTNSTAYLGDGSTHLLAALNSANLNRPFAIAGSLAQSAFTANASVTLTRFYDYGTAPAAETVATLLDYGLQTSPGATDIPLKQSEDGFTTTIGSYLAASGRIAGAANGWLSSTNTLSAEPNGVQLDSINNLHQFSAVLSHNENGGAFTGDFTNSSGPIRLLHFDGNLFCGPLLTLFTNLDSTPVVTNIVAGDHLDCSLAISANAGFIPGTSYTFGNGTTLPVSLAVNGDCTLKSGSVNATGSANDTDTIQNISFQRTAISLGTNGASAILTLNLPIGFSVRQNTPGTRLTVNTLPFLALLDASLRPQTNVLVQPAVPLTFSAETLPCWITTTAFSWRVYDGQLVLPGAGIQFVRQFEDDVLTANQFFLADTNTAKRISNDAYFRGAQTSPSPGFIVTADANGFAQVNGGINLQPPELRPHFPYTDNQPGSEIQTSAGLFTLENSLVTSNSSLALSGTTVPLLYSGDCADTNCSGATAGLQLVNLAPPGGQLAFTPDGGLLGYGPVSSPSNAHGETGVQLRWGYNGSGIFAQQTSFVTNGVYEMAGNFLRGDQTTLANSQRAVVMLFTGWGDDSNPNYLERYGMNSYLDGFANYSGLNLRAPVQASSYLANVPTGPYPLTSRAKFYARNGGVSGILEAASFPTNFALYGYAFNFSTYGLSYLDSDNWESRTDGGIKFPDQPAGFSIGFERI